MQTSDPRICCTNLGSEDLLHKPRIRRFCCASLGFTRNHLASRNQISAIRGNKPMIDSARKAAQPSVATNPRWLTIVACRAGVCVCATTRSIVLRCRGWVSCFAVRSFVALCRRRSNCFARAIGCGFVSVDGRAASLVQSIVGLLSRMAGVWLRDPR